MDFHQTNSGNWTFSRSSNFKASHFCSCFGKTPNFSCATQIETVQNSIQKASKEKNLKIANAVPIEYFSEEVTELAKREEQAVAEVARQLGQIWNCNHFHLKLCDNGFESEKRKI